ncbi:MAG: transglycosylase domain-containing protein, partial [Bacteroidales bacterium]|nr:transglycosylase domain-containing protein [Bacteroidales bacterium]
MAKNKKRNKKKVKSSKKNNLFRKFWRAIWITIIFLFVVSVLLTIAYRFINPPITILMIQRSIKQTLSSQEDVRIKKEWVEIDEISPNMILAVVASEDNLFLKHNGFDKK